MENRFFLWTLAAGCFFLFAEQSAQAQFVPMDQSRYLSTTAAGFGAGDAIDPVGPNQQFSNTITTAGPFTDSESAIKDFTDTADLNPNNDHPEYHAHANASQNSTVASTGFSGTGSTSAYSYWIPLLGAIETVDGNAQTGYTIDFTVPAETFFTIAGELDTHSNYSLGRRDLMHTSLVLSGSASGTLYSVGGDYVAPLPDLSNTFTLDIPISYSTLLEPGQTYTLSALATVDADNKQNGSGHRTDPSSASFNFVATVPEPASIGLMLMAGACLVGRRRRCL